MYKSEKFELRPLGDIKKDIDAMAAICNDLKDASWKIGHGGRITREAAGVFLKNTPELQYHHGFAMVFHWFVSGAKTAFIQDANSLIMKTDQLVEALRYLRKTFPTLNRVTSYARSKTVAQKSLDELTAIREAGLDRLHLGLESGDDEVLKTIKKGVTAEGHIKGGQKALKAGFQLSEYWMPGLGGKNLWENHARNTARVLNAINPHYIRSRPFHPWPGTPLNEAVESGRFQMLSPTEQLLELKMTMEALDVTSKVCFDHAANYWRNRAGGLIFTHSYEGYQFPQQKQVVINAIQEGLEAGNVQPVLNGM